MVVTLDPTGVRSADRHARAEATRRCIAGTRVGLVSNGLGRSVELLTTIHRLLQDQAGVGSSFLVQKPHRSSPPLATDWDRLLRDADVVITGFGGCGSCSTRSVRDAMELEWEGIPSVALVHEDVLAGVQALTRLAGMPDYRYVVVDTGQTSLCDWDDDTLASVAKSVVAEVHQLLEGPR